MTKMKRNLFLIFWIVGTLFPMIWLARVSPVSYRLFNILFSPPWMHIVMHTLLFAVLSALLLQSLYDRLAKGYAVAIVLALVFGVAVLQEGIQLFSGQQVLHPNNLFDIGVDMVGGAIGALLTLGFRKMRSTRAKQSLTTIE